MVENENIGVVDYLIRKCPVEVLIKDQSQLEVI